MRARGSYFTDLTAEAAGTTTRSTGPGVLFLPARRVTYSNPKTTNDRNVLAQIDNRIERSRPAGRAGLLGGNLSVLTGILGSPVRAQLRRRDFLFLEDVEEQPCASIGWMTSLRLAGVLEKVRGVVFGVFRLHARLRRLCVVHAEKSSTTT